MWINLWLKFMLVITREGEHLILHKCGWVHLHTQVGVLYVYVFECGCAAFNLCNSFHVQFQFIMYDWHAVCWQVFIKLYMLWCISKAKRMNQSVPVKFSAALWGSQASVKVFKLKGGDKLVTGSDSFPTDLALGKMWWTLRQTAQNLGRSVRGRKRMG